jgi:hypothetical protein
MGRLRKFVGNSGSSSLVHTTNHDVSQGTFFTEEGYLIDTPRVTRVGVFEYPEKPSDIRRQLRLPEEVFEHESLTSYKGKPVIVTHDAGEVTAENVAGEGIGAIMSEGMEDGEFVKAEIVIQDTDQLKKGFRELSLGYSLDLDKTPGIWRGQPYDCIQRNIRINHLALVESARAGDKSRLNIDSRKNQTEGESGMAKEKSRNSDCDETGTSIDLVKALEAVAEESAATDEGEENPIDAALEQQAAEGEEKTPQGDEDEENKDEDPETLEAALEAIRVLREELAALKAQQGDEGESSAEDDDENADEGEEEEPAEASKNADSIDRIVNEKLLLIDLGRKMGLDVRGMNLKTAKKSIVRKGSPGMNCDGMTQRELDVAVAMTARHLPKSTDRQRKQIFTRDGASIAVPTALSAREKMIRDLEGGSK